MVRYVQAGLTGDATASVDSNEKWLKYWGTWWSLETPAATDAKGKVIVDNKAPTVSNMKPQ